MILLGRIGTGKPAHEQPKKRVTTMKKNFSLFLMLALVVTLAGSAFAAGKKYSVTIPENTTVNGTELKAGDYKVELTGTGDNVQVNFLKGKQTVASAPAKLVENDPNATRDSVIVRKGKPSTLEALQFGSQRQTVQISAGGSATGQ